MPLRPGQELRLAVRLVREEFDPQWTVLAAVYFDGPNGQSRVAVGKAQNDRTQMYAAVTTPGSESDDVAFEYPVTGNWIILKLKLDRRGLLTVRSNETHAALPMGARVADLFALQFGRVGIRRLAADLRAGGGHPASGARNALTAERARVSGTSASASQRFTLRRPHHSSIASASRQSAPCATAAASCAASNSRKMIDVPAEAVEDIEPVVSHRERPLRDFNERGRWVHPVAVCSGQKRSGEPGFGLALLAGAEIAQRRAEQRCAGGGEPAVPARVADHRDLREGAAIAKVPAKVADEGGWSPAAKAAQVEEERDGR